MEIKKTFNTTIKEIESKKFNILLPICVGNRFFLDNTSPTENISKYLEWALKNTKDKILILIADKIQISNWIVRNSKPSEKQNMRRLMRKGEKIYKNILNLVKNLPKNKQDKIKVLRWEDYSKEDPFCENTTRIVYKEFENIEFREKVLEAVKNSITDRTFSEKEYLTLCKYVLDEFSLVYHGVKINGEYYGLYAYPNKDKVLELIENIKIKEIFQELEEKLPPQKISVILMK
jgi:tRNA-dependent cyclodipeptide synthase